MQVRRKGAGAGAPLPVLPHDGGWGPLLDAGGERLVAAGRGALPPDARLDFRPYMQACEVAGLGSDVADALQWLSDRSGARVIRFEELHHHIKSVARSLHAQLAAAASGSHVFVVESGPKSNLWVFLLLALEVRALCGGTASKPWREVRARMWLTCNWEGTLLALRSRGTPDQTHQANQTHQLPPVPVTLVFADDCAYSASQMSMLVRGSVKGLRIGLAQHDASGAGGEDGAGKKGPGKRGQGKKAAAQAQQQQPVSAVDVNVMLGCCTALAADRLVRSAPGLSLQVSCSIPGLPDQEVLAMHDVALCLRASDAPKDGPWIVTTLFSVLQVTGYRVQPRKASSDSLSCSSDSNSVFNGSRIAVGTSSYAGPPPTLTVFEHKLADSVSIPFVSTLLGPTLRAFLVAACSHAPCGSARMEVAVVPSAIDFFKALDDWTAATKNRCFLAVEQRNADVLPGAQGQYWVVQDAVLRDSPPTAPGASKAARPATAAQLRPLPAARVDALPVLCPLLRPLDACGQFIAAAAATAGAAASSKEPAPQPSRQRGRRSSGAAAAVAAAEAAAAPVAASGSAAHQAPWRPWSNASDALDQDLPCVMAPYKVLLKEILALPECQTASRALYR